MRALREAKFDLATRRGIKARPFSNERSDHFWLGIGFHSIVDVCAAKTRFETVILCTHAACIKYNCWPIKGMGRNEGIQSRGHS